MDRRDRLDVLTVIVEARPEAAGAAARDAQAKELVHHVKSMVGVSISVRVVDPGAVERSEGKAKRVLDLRARS